MPTASTAKIAAAKGERGGNHGGGGIYSRHRRPKSCKYDTYRLRSRTSVVEENLFGEPLKNKLMARSRSMEAISHGEPLDEAGGNGTGPGGMAGPAESQQPTLFTRRGPQHRNKHLCPRDDLKKQERPRTALATMRPSGGNSNPEFERRSLGQGGEPGVMRDPLLNNLNKKQTLVLSRRDFEKICQAAKIITSEDKELLRKQADEAREILMEEKEKRKAEFDTSASFHNTPEEAEQETENRMRDHHLIEKANDLKMEQLAEIKRLNQHITQVKCHAIRDVQMEEKEKRLSEMAEADRHLEESIELERKQAEQMEAARAAKTIEFNKEFRMGLDVQRAEIEAQKLVEKEKFESELALRRSLEAALKDQEMKEADLKKSKMLDMQQQMLVEVEENKVRKEKQAQVAKQNEERILALANARREAEIRKEEEAKKMKRGRERDMMRMKAAVEKEQALKMKREELRLLRQQEEEDRKWRQREMEVARLKALRDEELKRVRVAQMADRQRAAAISIERDRQHWDEVRNMWQMSVDKDKVIQDQRAKAKRDYLTTLQAQMSERARERAATLQDSKDDVETKDLGKESQQKKIQQLREKKLQQLRAYNVPEKYIKEIERKCQMAHKSKFTYSYFGLK